MSTPKRAAKKTAVKKVTNKLKDLAAKKNPKGAEASAPHISEIVVTKHR